MPVKTIIVQLYLAGVIISILMFIRQLLRVFRLFENSCLKKYNGLDLHVTADEIPAFSFHNHILIPENDLENNEVEIVTHELAHIRLGHFYDLMLIELMKIIYWFNPLVYKLNAEIKEIHEFEADEAVIRAGVDPTKYQLLIIQKCAGHQSFALANSFNHCQIKKRLAMMNKSKTSKAWRWKVATFLPLSALLLMAFGHRDEVPGKAEHSFPVSVPARIIQNNFEEFKRRIELKNDGNYIDNKKCSLDEIAVKGQEWYGSTNDWILLLADEAIPVTRIDEVRSALKNNYWIVQATLNSNDLIYFSGDVSENAKFTKGNFNEWLTSQLNGNPETKDLKYSIGFSFIVGKDGKTRVGHVVKTSGNQEIDAVYNRILSEIPDWKPAERSNENVSVYFYFTSGAFE